MCRGSAPHAESAPTTDPDAGLGENKGGGAPNMNMNMNKQNAHTRLLLGDLLLEETVVETLRGEKISKEERQR